MYAYNTITDAMKDLKSRGYTRDFNLKTTFLECATSGHQLFPQDFEITEVYRFEGDSDPGDEMVLYAIDSKKGLKGTFVNAFGTYADPVSDEMIAKLRFHK